MTLEESISAIDRLRRPAGQSELWSTFELLKENSSKFFESFHRGCQILHFETVTKMLDRETELNRDINALREDSQTRSLRRINDSIAWIGLAEKRHIVKIICHWNPKRGLLSESNPMSTLEWMLESIDLSKHFGIWTDTTSFMGVGDATIFGPLGHYKSIELKELGEHIFAFQADTSREQLTRFRKEAQRIKGQSGGDRTTDRLQRQLNRLKKSEDFVKADKGVHPFTNIEYELTTHSATETTYGSELNYHIHQAIQGDSSCHLVEDCLWIVAYPKYEIVPRAFLGSACMVFNPNVDKSMIKETIDQISAETYSSIQMQNYPICKPPCLLDIDDISAGAIMSEEVVLLSYLDWPKFGEAVAKPRGLEFHWLDVQKATEQMSSIDPTSRPLVTPRGVPCFRFDTMDIQLGQPTLFRMLGDFTRPSCIIDEIVTSEFRQT